MTLTTFAPVDGEEADMTLGDLKTNCAYDEGGDVWSGWDMENDVILMYSTDGACSDPMKNVPDWYPALAEETEDPGWYAAADMGTYANNLNETPLVFGCGVLAKAKASFTAGRTPTFLYSGAVKGNTNDTPVYAFSMTGNCSPVGITLGDVKTNCAYDEGGDQWFGWDMDNDVLLIYGEDGSCGDPLKNVPDWYPALAEETEDPGWYAAADMGTYINNLNSTQIPAGKSFIVKAKASRAAGRTPTLLIPPAIKK